MQWKSSTHLENKVSLKATYKVHIPNCQNCEILCVGRGPCCAGFLFPGA